MKKYVIFSITSILLFSIFTATLYFGGGPAVSSFLKTYKIYILAFSALALTYFIISWYKHYKNYKSLSCGIKTGAKLTLKANASRNKKFNLWMTIMFTCFLVITQMLIYLHLSENNYVLLVAGITVIYMVVTVLLNLNRVKNHKLQLEKAKQAEEMLTLKLRSIRSQLNPHFMFNALTSIQNLMNKKNVPAANHYLAMFANLTRKVLNTTDQELISLEDELQILEDYLQMEQLRFGFQYQVIVDENINKANTEIPAMLLQPFVENAVKHGVAALQQKGIIKIKVDKQLNTLILSVTDNGSGFDENSIENNTASLGLKLSRERVALLNEVNKSETVLLTIDSQPVGTQITITLINLLA